MTMIIFISEKTTRNESIGNVEISVCNNNRKTTMEIEHYIYSKMSHNHNNMTQFQNAFPILCIHNAKKTYFYFLHLYATSNAISTNNNAKSNKEFIQR